MTIQRPNTPAPAPVAPLPPREPGCRVPGTGVSDDLAIAGRWLAGSLIIPSAGPRRGA